MDDFIQFCNNLSQLDKVSTDDLMNNLKSKAIQKGDYLLKDGNICRNLYFINKGLTKTYFNKDDKEFIMRFFPENIMFTVLDSYLTQAPSQYMILVLEPTTITFISFEDLDALCKKYHCIENLF
jgi:signal-transduction protein with cAMP-binding, CBS, and nucleotidyltransferase domain